MAFLDNSGDIILDAVLTDTGRMRLAKGDGSFRITKFALGDDEINYTLYNKNHPSGSAYFDIDIMQTPVFEAFSNNIASLNSRLVSISRNNLLYLPVIKINDKAEAAGDSNFSVANIVRNGYLFAVDQDTEKMLQNTALTYFDGTNTVSVASKFLNGLSTTIGTVIRVDQGIDNTSVPPALDIDPDLNETQYLIEIDNRFGSIINPKGDVVATPSYIDDDSMAAYYFSYGVDTDYIQQNTNKLEAGTSKQVIAGSRGTILRFKIKAAIEVTTSDYLFNQLGTDGTSKYKISGVAAGSNIRTINATVRITGLTTGYAVDIPIVLIKKIS